MDTTTSTRFLAVIFTVIFICSPSYLQAFPSNLEDNLDDISNNINLPLPEEDHPRHHHHHQGRQSPSDSESDSEGATDTRAAETSPSSPSDLVVPDSNAIVTVDQMSQIFGINFQNHSDTKTRKGKQSRKDGTPKFMLDLYKQVANSTNGETFGDTPYGATTIRSLMIERGSRSKRNILHFKMDSIPLTERLLRAELHLFRLISKLKGTSGRPKFYQVGIYQRTDRDKPKLIDRRQVSSRGTGREVFNVESTVHEWLADRATNYGLYINVTLLSGEPAPEGALRFSLKNIDRKPTLFLFTREEEMGKDSTSGNLDKLEGGLPKFIEGSNVPVSSPDTASSPTSGVVEPVRNKRGIKAPYVPSEDLCRVEPLFVDFAVLGWSQRILAPIGFNANQCTGACPFPANIDTPYSTHALVQSFMAMQTLNTANTACCVPHELSPVAILYFDDSENIILRHVRNAVAVKCGCH